MALLSAQGSQAMRQRCAQGLGPRAHGAMASRTAHQDQNHTCGSKPKGQDNGSKAWYPEAQRTPRGRVPKLALDNPQLQVTWPVFLQDRCTIPSHPQLKGQSSVRQRQKKLSGKGLAPTKSPSPPLPWGPQSGQALQRLVVRPRPPGPSRKPTQRVLQESSLQSGS